MNTWHVTTANLKPVYQYDVVIGAGNEKRGLIKRVWDAPSLQKQLGVGWIFDGAKIAYSLHKQDSINVELDLDVEYGKEPRKNKDGQPRENKCRIRIKHTKRVPMQNLDAYLNGKGPWDVNCLEAMTCLDRLMRETPSRRFTSIKRNFYSRGQQRTTIGSGIEAMKGVYISIRPVLAGFGRPACLSVNVDVANTTFWIASPLHIVASQLLGSRDIPSMVAAMRPKGNQGVSPALTMLNALRRVRVTATYRSKAMGAKEPDEFVIDKFLPIRARDKTFTARDKNGKEYPTNVEEYMTSKYQTRLQYPDLPLVKMTKGHDTCIPMELLTVADMQRYSRKLNDRQTSEMIKFAVTLPQQRWRDIDNGVTMLEWRSDKYLQNYGITVGAPAKVEAVLLPPPKVMFAQGSPPAEPKTSGRWDLRGKRFIDPHPTPLKSWGVCVVPGRGAPDKATVQNFISSFIRIFEGHGGKVANKQPMMIQGTADAGNCVSSIWSAAGDQMKQPPQLLVFIVPDKSAQFYAGIKKSADCRYGVVSQVLQAAHVQRAQAQYCSNVALKVNAKLGGVTARAAGIKSNWFTRPTMIVGADVSHGAPGTEAASIAAITVSWDRSALRYAAGVETNGRRVEMITEANWNGMFKGLYQQWVKAVGQGRHPEHIIYLRDGVSEGQYSQVLDQEVSAMAKVVSDVDPHQKPKFTVLTCTKRHHVRFFPEGQAADRNGNPQPGTLVEQGATDPADFDFYLCAHSAIKGTARPVHYSVLRDDVKLSQVDLQNMIYEASYQYVRSTTPVSLHPAIYYAHLAALRAGSHVSKTGSDEATRTGTSELGDVEPLVAMPNARGIKGTMWYV